MSQSLSALQIVERGAGLAEIEAAIMPAELRSWADGLRYLRGAQLRAAAKTGQIGQVQACTRVQSIDVNSADLDGVPATTLAIQHG